MKGSWLIDRPRLWSQLGRAINSIIQFLWVPSRCIHRTHESLQASKLTDFINFLQPENPAVIDSVEKSEELQVLSKTVLSDSPDYTELVGKALAEQSPFSLLLLLMTNPHSILSHQSEPCSLTSQPASRRELHDAVRTVILSSNSSASSCCVLAQAWQNMELFLKPLLLESCY